MASEGGPPLSLRKPAARYFFAIAWGLGVVIGLSEAAMAQPAPDQASEADKEKARGFMDVGVEREEAKDYAAALKAFQAAHALVGLPMTGYAVARAQAGLGLLVEAKESAMRAKSIPVRPNETPAYAKARSEAAALAEKLDARIPLIKVKVSGPSAGAEIAIAIDGKALSSAEGRVNPGKHVVSAEAAGYEPASAEVDVAEGQTLPVTLSMPPMPVASNSKSAGLSPLVFVGFGLGAAGIITGAVTGALSLGKTSSIRDQCDENGFCPSTTAGDISSATTLANVSNISFAVGAAGAALGVVGIFVLSGSSEEKKPASGGVRVMPAVGLGSAGVVGVF
ncbi:MAG: hypothetical protein HUU21_23965 [Polyangiaceae bacterium]|nr:hypothetical protein [Polyangiaceae bacterium]